MEIAKLLMERAKEAGFFEYGLLDTRDLVFYPEVRDMCAKNTCRAYGTTWACPPAVGTLEECREKVLGYGKMLLLSVKYDLEDSFDFEGMTEGMHSFKRTMERFESLIEGEVTDYFIFSNEGCGKCKTCTYPDAPCRFPDKLHPSLEGYCFMVSELAKQAGIHYINGANTVTYFGGILWNE